MDHLDHLAQFANDCLKSETENAKEAIRLAGSNSPGACMAMGACDAYQTILLEIAQLEYDLKRKK